VTLSIRQTDGVSPAAPATSKEASTASSTGGYPRKRRQTRGRLLRAGTIVLVEKGPAQVTAGQIANAAGVAVGTFYNHFPTVDAFVAAVADDLSRAIEIGRDTLNEIEHDPAQRVALGVLQLLELADTDPRSASAFVTLAALRPDFRSRIRAVVSQAINDGVEAQVFDVAAGQAAINAVLGAALQSMRSRVLNETDHDEAPAVAHLVLRLLGMAEVDIVAAVAHAGTNLVTD
jgi:AcrR family transcriptional regulator